MTIKRGDVFRHVLAGAGGWGDPLERDPAAVLQDVRNELLSPPKAAADYGVVIDTTRWTVDAAATARRRAEMRAAPRLARGAQGPVARPGSCCSARRSSAHDRMTTYRIGVDIGGTFTDIVLLGSDGTIHTKKISSSVDNYARAIVDGPGRAASARPGSPAARSRRSATARRSPPTPSSSTRARASA